MIKLRDYQEESVRAIYEYFDRSLGKSPLVVAPTGSGKSIIIADFIKRTCSEWPHVRVLVITDSRDLIAQNEKQMRAHWQDASTGIYSAGLGKRQTQAQITFCGIQSIYNKAYSLGKIDIIIIDECHMIPRSAQTRYGQFLKDMLIANPSVVLIGFSATPYRLDSGMLHEGEDALFDGIAYVCEMKLLIKQGYLTPVVSKGGVMKIDLSGIHIRAGEWDQRELAHAADDPELVRLAVQEIVQYGWGRKAWLIFASGVEHAEHVANEIRKYNVECEVVTGDTPNTERDRIIDRFKSGKLRCMVNVAVFTKGFDAPICDLIALLMATKSTGKYVQIVGRGMRPYPEKENCLLLDYGQNVITHGPIDEVDPVKRKDIFRMEKKAAPMKECPKCHVIIHARSVICPGCGFEFPVSARHGTEAFDGAVLSDQQKPFMVDVTDTWVSRHKKSGKPDSVKLAFYDSMEKEWPMWLSLNSTSPYAVEKSQAIVKQLGGKATDVDSALAEHFNWKQVEKIQVRMDGRFPRILGFVFKKNQSVQEQLLGGEKGEG
jgi:DNA repair protein RadD